MLIGRCATGAIDTGFPSPDPAPRLRLSVISSVAGPADHDGVRQLVRRGQDAGVGVRHLVRRGHYGPRSCPSSRPSWAPRTTQVSVVSSVVGTPDNDAARSLACRRCVTRPTVAREIGFRSQGRLIARQTGFVPSNAVPYGPSGRWQSLPRDGARAPSSSGEARAGVGRRTPRRATRLTTCPIRSCPASRRRCRSARRSTPGRWPVGPIVHRNRTRKL